MKVYLDFMQPIPAELLRAGAVESTTVYMKELVQAPRNVIDHALVKATALKYEASGVRRVILDVEHVNDAPNLSAVFQWTNEETRWMGVVLMCELLVEFRQWYTGEIAVSGWHPSYWDYVGIMATDPINEARIEAKWQYFNKWESDLRPITALTDFSAPFIYSETMWTTGWNRSYAARQRMWGECYEIMRASMKHWHGYDRKIEWKIAPHLRDGVKHTEAFIDWQFEQIKAFGDDVHIWLGPEAKFGTLSDKMLGVIIGNITNSGSKE